MKWGSRSNANGRGMRRQRLYGYAGEVAEQKALGRAVIIVASGSIAVAKAILPVSEVASPKVTQQMLATRGNPHLMRAWQDALRRYDIQGGELLLTHHEIEDKGERKKLVDGILDHLDAGWVPIINENDGMSDIEIAELAYGGDNDGLASEVAQQIGAEHLCFMTEMSGLLDHNDQLIGYITAHNAEWAKQFDRGNGNRGRGGMTTKINAGVKAARLGVKGHIAHAESRVEDVISFKTGTHFAVTVTP